jgi:Flp pilus assembly protein TadG
MRRKMLMQNILAKPAAAAMRQLLRPFIGGAEAGTGGIAAVEFALILPALVLMMISTVDFGMGFYRKMQVYEAARAGAQYASANGFNATKISTAVTSATSFSGIAATPAPHQDCGCAASTGVTFNGDTAPFCTSKCPDTTVAGTYVTASAQATYTTMLSYPTIPASFAFAAQTTVRIQ